MVLELLDRPDVLLITRQLTQVHLMWSLGPRAAWWRRHKDGVREQLVCHGTVGIIIYDKLETGAVLGVVLDLEVLYAIVSGPICNIDVKREFAQLDTFELANADVVYGRLGDDPLTRILHVGNVGINLFIGQDISCMAAVVPLIDTITIIDVGLVI